jgi:hypothetical protein
MTALNSVAVRHANQAPGLFSLVIISCSPAVRTTLNGSYGRRSYSASAGEPIRIGLLLTLPRLRNLSVSNSPSRVSEFLNIGFV